MVQRSTHVKSGHRLWRIARQATQQGPSLPQQMCRRSSRGLTVGCQPNASLRSRRTRLEVATTHRPGVNTATFMAEKLQVPTTNGNLAIISAFGRDFPLAAWVLDEASAYRQIPITPAHRRFAVVTMFTMVGHSFGLMPAAIHLNRRSAGVNDTLLAAGLVSQAYHENHFGFSSLNLVAADLAVAQEVHTLLGMDFRSDKRKAGHE